ncbi:MAG TPA: hypothetical protein VNO33_06345, partial [Kofleriaceae bacterium]|nr:hypothetical protein [Kofleriaceae bacterium]
LRPDFGAALDLVAASQVAELAGRSTDPAREAGDRALASDAAPADAGWRGSAEAARAQLPRELWPVFDAVYLSLGEEADARPLAPSARAARALALASRSTDGGALPARARTAAAWAVLPVILPGGAGREAFGAGETTRAGAPAGQPGPRARARSRAGEALSALVAPAMLVADGREQAAKGAADRTGASASLPLERPSFDSAFVQTAQPARPAPPAPPAPAPPPPRPASPSPDAEMAAIYEKAMKFFSESGPSSAGISLAEMTLVTAAPRAQIAASARTADRGVAQASSTTAVGGGDGKPADGPPGVSRPDIDKIAQEVFDQICRMMAVARERSGDPWQR